MSQFAVLPPPQTMTPLEALGQVENELRSGKIKHVFVIGYHEEDRRLITRNSEMSRETANWMVDGAKGTITGWE